MFPFIIAGAIGFVVAKLFEEDEAPKYAKGGSVLLAPNGKPSNLTPEQYKLVRTPAFKKWFGDWENDPANASKVVDSNGEPKVYYQGLPYYLYPNGKNIYEEDNNGIFFTSNKKNALTYGAVKSMFIKCINPKDVRNYFGYDGKKISDNLRNDKKYNYKTKEEKQYINSDLNVIKFYEDVIDKYGKSFEILDENEGKEFVFKNKEEIKKFLIPTSEKGFLFLNFKYRSAIWNWIGNYIKNSQYDGLFATDEDSLAEEISDSIVVYNSNQIKLADGSNTTFDGNNPDIRYAGGGDVSAPKNVQIKIFDEQETYFYSAIKNQKNNDVWTFTKTSKSKATENYENTNIFQYKNYDSMLNSAKRIANDESTITIYDEQGKGKNYLLKDYFNNPDIRFDDGGGLNENYADDNYINLLNNFYENVKIENGSKYIGQKFMDIFPFLGRKKVPQDFRKQVNQYDGVIRRLKEDNYTTKAMKQTDLNKLEKINEYMDKKKYLSRFYLDNRGVIINFK